MSRCLLAVLTGLLLACFNVSAVYAAKTKTCDPASAYLPMAKKKAIPNPTKLAALIRSSLGRDALGNSMIEGAHTTPLGYLVAMNAAGANVKGVGALPEYLKTLIEKKMPTYKVTMSRVLYKKNADCTETYEVDIKVGYTRQGIDEERAWVDPGTGYMILAEDCTNSPLKPITLDEAKTLLTTAPPDVPGKTDMLVGACKENSHQTLFLHVWDHDSFSEALKAEYLDIAEKERDFEGPSVGREMGGKLRKTGRLDKIRHFSTPFDARVSLMKRDDADVIMERNVETVTVQNGVWSKRFPVSLTKKWSVRIIPAPSPSVDVEIMAPFVSPKTGFPELQFHPYEWGEFCQLHIHAVVKKLKS